MGTHCKISPSHVDYHLQEDQAGSFSLSGTVYGVLASLFVSLFSIYTKKVSLHLSGAEPGHDDTWCVSR